MLYTDQTVRKILYIIYYIYPITINHTYIQCVLSLFHSFSTWMHELNRNVYTKVMKLQQNKNNLYDSDGFKINGAYNVLCSNKYTWCHHHWTGFSSQFFFLSLFHYNKKKLTDWKVLLLSSILFIYKLSTILSVLADKLNVFIGLFR